VRLTRLKFTVRQMMAAVAIVALLLAAHITWQRWADYRREAAYHGQCEQFFSLLADRRLGELPRVPFRADADAQMRFLGTKLTRPAEWAASCRSFAVDHHRETVCWASRW
jgi:hypothetical protein